MGKYFVKVTWNYQKDGVVVFTSVRASQKWSVDYIPGEWIKPKLPGSKLFVFQNVRAAFDYLSNLSTGWYVDDDYPYRGLVPWWCEARGVKWPEIIPIKEPPDWLLEDFWENYPRTVPLGWHYRNLLNLSVLFADEVNLWRPIKPSEFARLLDKP